MFLLAQVGSGVYNVLLILHILSVIVAFAPATVHTLVGGRLQKDDEGALRRFFGAASLNTRMVHLPALAAVGLLGFALVGLSDDAFEFSDPWVAISILLWVIIAGLVGAVVLPGERGMATGEAGAAGRVSAAGGVASLLLVIVVALMVIKPG